MGTHPASGIRRLASGRLAEVDARGRATLLGCSWLVEVASGNPEPESIEDTVRIIECGAALFDDWNGGWYCAGGHHHHPLGSAAWQAEDEAEWMAERQAAGR